MVPVSLIVAFVGGVVSFLSPCVLPIIPGFLAYLAGTELDGNHSQRWGIFINSIFFVLGFSLVFAVLGVVLNSVLSGAAYAVQRWVARVGGVLIIFFGLYLTGLLKIPFLEREHAFVVKKRFSSRYLTSLLFGAAFAAGWTPCVGAALGAILAIAATEPARAFSLLFCYSLGLGLPFLLVGLFAAQAQHLIQRLGVWLQYLSIAFGVLLIALGILVFTENLSLIANWSLLNSVLLR